jgi:hypothetical protein
MLLMIFREWREAATASGATSGTRLNVDRCSDARTDEAAEIRCDLGLAMSPFEREET